MKTVYGFDEARKLLDRGVSAGKYNVTPEMARRLNDMFGTDDPEKAVRQIIEDVRCRGDAALYDYTFKIDGVRLESLEVGRKQAKEARDEVEPRLISALKLAADRIYSFYEAQRQAVAAGLERMKPGTVSRVLDTVAVYAPGGNAWYPSTVLMTAIPARVAGVKKVILVTPPGRKGGVPPVTLAAADIARVDRIFSLGGAQAIAAVAFGTETVPRVDKICGPGNIFVTLAKKLVFGAVDIDGLAGPSEVVIIADGSADPAACAAEMLAQCEHDSLASAILITVSSRLADEVKIEVARQVAVLPREITAGASLQRNGVIAVVDDIEQAFELSNMYAPEHLCLDVACARDYVGKIANAGCVFIGEKPTVAMGDYVAGPSHVLPTGGTARFGSPLNITDFIKYINVVDVSGELLSELGPAAITIARAEGLEAHARTVEKRMEK